MQSDGKEKVTRLWILRHGRSTLNRAQTFQGCGAESELSEEGIRSAIAAGERLKCETIDRIYTSPLKRAVQTAELVRTTLRRNRDSPKLEVAGALREIELPGWEGLPFAAVRERYAVGYRQFRRSPDTFSLHDPERGAIWPVLELEQRVHRFLTVLLRDKAGERILLVTHGGPANIILLAALHLQVRYFHSVQMMHGGLSCLRVQRWPDLMKLEALNDVSHLRDLPKLKEGKNGLRLLLVSSDGTQKYDAQEDVLARVLGHLQIHRTLAAEQEGMTTAMRLLTGAQRSTIEACTAAGLRGAIDRHLVGQHSDQLFNLLITGRGDLLTSILRKSMRWDGRKTHTNLESCHGLCVIHLPNSTKHPVLQAVNIYRMCEPAKEGIA